MKRTSDFVKLFKINLVLFILFALALFGMSTVHSSDEESAFYQDLRSAYGELKTIVDQLQRDQYTMAGANEMTPSVIKVFLSRGSGSGVAFRSVLLPKNPDDPVGRAVYRTYFLTAAHVVWNSDINELQHDISFEMYDGSDFNNTTLTVLTYDRDLDVAVVYTDALVEYPCVAELDLEEPEINTKVMAIGCPLGLLPVATEGWLIKKYHTFLNDNWIHTSHTIFGSSGGAIFRADNNKLIGLTVAIYVTGWQRYPIYYLGSMVPVSVILEWLSDSPDYHYLVE